MPWPVMYVLARVGVQNWHQRIKVEIAKAGEKRIAMFRRKLQHRLYQRVREKTTTCLAGASLGYVETYVHSVNLYTTIGLLKKLTALYKFHITAWKMKAGLSGMVSLVCHLRMNFRYFLCATTSFYSTVTSVRNENREKMNFQMS